MVEKIKDYEMYEGIKDEYVILDLYADWCGPCKMIAPTVEKMSEVFKNIKFFKVNVDEVEKIATDFGVQSIPTLIILKNKAEIARKIGFVTESALQTWIKENTSID